MEKWLFFRFQFCNRLSLFARILLPFFFDLFDPFLDLRDSKRDFFLFLLKFLKCNDFVAQLGKVGRLGGAFAPEIYFTLLQKAPLVTQRQARSLASDFQSDLAETCPDETHENDAIRMQTWKKKFPSGAA